MRPRQFKINLMGRSVGSDFANIRNEGMRRFLLHFHLDVRAMTKYYAVSALITARLDWDNDLSVH